MIAVERERKPYRQTTGKERTLGPLEAARGKNKNTANETETKQIIGSVERTPGPCLAKLCLMRRNSDMYIEIAIRNRE